MEDFSSLGLRVQEADGGRAFNLGQILPRSSGGFALAFSHLPLVQWYEPEGGLTAATLRGPAIEQMLKRFAANQYSCDGGKYQRYGTAVPVITRSAALVDDHLYPLIGNSLFRLGQSNLIPVDWRVDGASVWGLVSQGGRLGVRMHDGRLHLMGGVDAREAETR